MGPAKFTAAGLLSLAVLFPCWASAPIAMADDPVDPPGSLQWPASDDAILTFLPADAKNSRDALVSDEPAPRAEKPKPPTEEPAEEKKDEEAEEEGPWKLFQCPWLECRRIDIRGWIDQGFTANPYSPQDRFNGPVGYNDRANEYELNQLYLIGERVTKTDGCGWDIGGRVDLLYGTDRRFPVAYELDSDWNLGQRFYGLVMPQMYADIAVNDLVIRAGHFLAPCGYESVMAPENFFYSHSYSFLYAQPTTLSGGQLICKIDDQWTANAGIDTGWNDWIAPNGKVNYFGGLNWASEDKKSTLAFEMFLGNTNPVRGVDSDRTHYCLVYTQKLGEKWRYALEHNLGYDTNPFGTGVHGDWLSFANYLFYDVNPCWSFGGRYEWFLDDDATVTTRVGPPPAGPWPAHFNTLALGLNYRPHASKNVLVRSETRWDWAGDPLPAGQRPFNDGTENNQFLWATDLIVRF